jgi:predicted RNase H-like HicB family nuclease
VDWNRAARCTGVTGDATADWYRTGGGAGLLPSMAFMAGLKFEAAVGESRMREMARQFDVVIERDEEGMYVASVPQLPGCHTDASSLDELMAEIREAIELCLEVQGREPVQLEFIGIQRVTVAA